MIIHSKKIPVFFVLIVILIHCLNCLCLNVSVANALISLSLHQHTVRVPIPTRNPSVVNGSSAILKQDQTKWWVKWITFVMCIVLLLFISFLSLLTWRTIIASKIASKIQFDHVCIDVLLYTHICTHFSCIHIHGITCLMYILSHSPLPLHFLFVSQNTPSDYFFYVVTYFLPDFRYEVINYHELYIASYPAAPTLLESLGTRLELQE